VLFVVRENNGIVSGYPVGSLKSLIFRPAGSQAGHKPKNPDKRRVARLERSYSRAQKEEIHFTTKATKLKKEKRVYHEGHEEHEVYRKQFPNPW
jgi:hypothetical protein